MVNANQIIPTSQINTKQYEALVVLRDELLQSTSDKDKLQILQNFLSEKKEDGFYEANRDSIKKLIITHQIIIEALFAIGQGDSIFHGITSFEEHKKEINDLITSLLPVEAFYDKIGGIVGYHVKFLQLLREENGSQSFSNEYERPPGIDLTDNTCDVKAAIRSGIETLEEIGEIYPIAGAADRLDLHDSITNESLPAAALEFLGFTLLEGLIRDVEAREYLYYKIKNKQLTIPIILMTSEEKNNFSHIKTILETHHWFHRGKNAFYFVQQALAPMIRMDGEWAVKTPLVIAFKPGGHGTIWKLIQDQGAISWLESFKKEKVLIRQINNPIAGVDSGLLALSGIGCRDHKTFGFASCDRYLKSEEGMDVLIKKTLPDGYQYSITNIEYTVFGSQGIEDSPELKESPYSKFPSNTNILFANLALIKKIITDHPFPGLMINLKSSVLCHNAEGSPVKLQATRLETTMQNIADHIIKKSSHTLSEQEKRNLPSFVTYNKRHKTLSTTKRSYIQGKELRDTPEGTLIEVMRNSKELLTLCGFDTPSLNEKEDFINAGPSFLFTYHPALGPLYQVIMQKLKKGLFHEKSELKLEIAEVFIENLEVKGSLLVLADQITGHLGSRGAHEYSSNSGKCILRNVLIQNQGIDPQGKSLFWKYQINRLECVKIKIQGNGEFIAENVIFKGNYDLIVPSGHKMRAHQNGELVEFTLEPLVNSSWAWTYQFNADNEITLKLDQF